MINIAGAASAVLFFASSFNSLQPISPAKPINVSIQQHSNLAEIDVFSCGGQLGLVSLDDRPGNTYVWTIQTQSPTVRLSALDDSVNLVGPNSYQITTGHSFVILFVGVPAGMAQTPVTVSLRTTSFDGATSLDGPHMCTVWRQFSDPSTVAKSATDPHRIDFKDAATGGKRPYYYDWKLYSVRLDPFSGQWFIDKLVAEKTVPTGSFTNLAPGFYYAFDATSDSPDVNTDPEVASKSPCIAVPLDGGVVPIAISG